MWPQIRSLCLVLKSLGSTIRYYVPMRYYTLEMESNRRSSCRLNSINASFLAWSFFEAESSLCMLLRHQSKVIPEANWRTVGLKEVGM